MNKSPYILALLVITITTVSGVSINRYFGSKSAPTATANMPNSLPKGWAVEEETNGEFNRGILKAKTAKKPNFVTKQSRRFKVFKTAFQLFWKYKKTQRQEKKLRKKLGIALNDPDGDDHPQIRALWDSLNKANANYLLLKIQELEGFWVKVGQYLSSRADVMPKEYLTTLSTLQDSMPPRSLKDTWSTIQEELSPEDLGRFDFVDPQPLSTASLAQVHRATLKDGKEVVIKVQHRGVGSLMIDDMENLRIILEILKFFEPDFDFGPVVKEYNMEVRKELDFRKEAANMNEVRSLIEEAQIPAIIPKLIPGMVKERVLVMDFCHGFPVRDTAKLDECHVNRELLLERVCACWAVQMHVGGVFNADPHMGNVLVSTDPSHFGDDTSVPVLLDFGLTKRLSPPMKVAFARLMHASYESDIDGLLQSYDEMGLKMNRYDPFEDMANMQRGFSTTVKQSEARKESKERSKRRQQKVAAMREDQGLEKGQKLRNPVEAWPSELVFFGRVTAMLQGMCSHLEVNHPYLKTMAMAARDTLCQDVPTQEHVRQLIHPSSSTTLASMTDLQKQLEAVVHELDQEGRILGLQVCVRKEGNIVASVAAGQLGTANPRPVLPSSCFNVFSVSKGVLAIGLLRLIQEGKVSLDDPVSKYWPSFQKDNITIRHVLTHQAGLASAMPNEVTLDTMLDWDFMKKFMETAETEHEPGTEQKYHALTFAWLVGGIIEEVTGMPYDKYIDSLFEENLDVYLGGIPDHMEDKELAVLAIDRKTTDSEKPSDESRAKAMEKEKGEYVKKLQEEKAKKTKQDGNQEDASDDDGDEDSSEEKDEDEEQQKKRKAMLAKYKGKEQLMTPTVFNMRKVRNAKIPSANGHASASGLAAVFDSLLKSKENPVLSSTMLDVARTPSSLERPQDEALLDNAGSSFGLGFQVHEFTLPDGNIVRSIGHAGLGGSLVVAIPEAQLTVAFVTNQLSQNSPARNRLLDVIFRHYNIQVPASLYS